MNPQLIYYDISAAATAFTTTRHGGQSRGPYAAFNANAYCGDNLDDVQANRQALCQTLAIPSDRLIIPHQTHQTNILTVDNDFLALPHSLRAERLEAIDALVTDIPQTAIAVSTADCVPVIIHDPRHHAAAAIHAGWRGTVARIVEKTISHMQRTFQTRPADCQAVIGPSISLKNFEVGDEVYEAFQQAGFHMPDIARRYPMQPSPDGISQQDFQNPHTTPNNASPSQTTRWHIDLWQCNRQQLLAQGLTPDAIQIAGICTYDTPTDYFSARRLGINSGRLLTGIVLRG